MLVSVVVVVAVGVLASMPSSALANINNNNNNNNSNKKNGSSSLPTSDDHYDFLIFTQVWPPTSCYEWRDKSPSNGCNLPADPHRWTIHGLWPTRNHSIGPFYCNHSIHFNLDSLEPIRQQLEANWLDVHKGAKPHEFWRHEWEKHGSCSLDLPALRTELAFFKMGLALLQRYDMHQLLGQASILPGNSYRPDQLLAGLGRVLTKRPYLECATNKHKNQSYLSELRICLDKQFELIHCDAVVDFPTNCKRDQDLLYPASVPDYFHQPVPVAIQV